MGLPWLETCAQHPNSPGPYESRHFLFANSRHVGFAMPWARPPVDLYGFLPIHSVDGVEASQQWMDGEVTWLLRGAVGQFRAIAAGNIPGIDRIGVTGKDAVVLTGQREAGGLLVKASFIQNRLSLDIGDQLRPLVAALDPLAALPIPGLADQIAPLRAGLWTGGRVRYSSLGLQYDSDLWLVHAEASRLQVTGGSLLPSWRGYFSLGYRWRDMTAYGILGRTVSDKAAATAPSIQGALTQVIGPVGAAQAQAAIDAAAVAANSYRYDQSTAALGLRWDVTNNVAVKFQIDRTHVHRNGAAMWLSDGGSAAARNAVASLMLDFVWGQ